jgi:transcription initiation factor TFIIE subunit alpha
MRLTQKKIEEILTGILGQDGLTLIQELIGKENISEFDLAKKIKKDIKVVRKMLYLLYNFNLVGFTRKKDKQKGWYIYYWTLLPESIKFNYFKMKRELMERYQQQLDDEQGELFFVCPNDCVRLNFDQAMEFEFHCPECGELINQDEGDKQRAELKKKIEKLQEELEKLKLQREVKRKVVKEKKKEVKEKKKVVRKSASKAKVPKKSAKKVVSKKKKVEKKKTVKKKVKKK